MSDLKTLTQNNDSTVKSKQYFNNYQKDRISYPSNQVDAVVGFFESKGFEKQAAISVSTVLLQQAKIDNINVMTLIDDLKTFDLPKLNELIGAILNNQRDKTSLLGFKETSIRQNQSRRNIIF
jgi:hypothetical protein